MTTDEIYRNKRFLKHDLRTPLNRILVESLATSLESIKPKYKQIRLKCQMLLERGEILDDMFSSSWVDENCSDNEKLDKYFTKAKDFFYSVIPLLEEDNELLEFFSEYHFGDTHKDQMNYDSVKLICSTIPFVREALESMIYFEDKEVEIARVNLLSVIQKVFDPVWIADVEYNNLYEFSSVFAKADSCLLNYNVLNNIRNNIEKHAFGTKHYKDLLHFYNIIRISYRIKDNDIRIEIANNGTKFKGDPNKLFTDGYCFGEKKNTGHGLSSALKAMRDMGGDLSVELHPKTDFSFSYILTLPLSL